MTSYTNKCPMMILSRWSTIRLSSTASAARMQRE